MSDSIQLSPAQVTALASLAERCGGVSLRQLGDGSAHSPIVDVYVTPLGSRSGVRIAPDGAVSEMGETLPAD
jgi:hypothetical protein